MAIIYTVRKILENSGLGEKYWPYAVDRVVYVKGSHSHAVLDCTPCKILNDQEQVLLYVRDLCFAALIYKNSARSKLRFIKIPGM